MIDDCGVDREIASGGANTQPPIAKAPPETWQATAQGQAETVSTPAGPVDSPERDRTAVGHEYRGLDAETLESWQLNALGRLSVATANSCYEDNRGQDCGASHDTELHVASSPSDYHPGYSQLGRPTQAHELCRSPILANFSLLQANQVRLAEECHEDGGLTDWTLECFYVFSKSGVWPKNRRGGIQ